MVDSALGSVEGPRTIQYFTILLTLAVMLFVVGVMLSQFYGFTLLERLMKGIIDNPMALMDLAGFLALLALGGTLIGYAQKL